MDTLMGHTTNADKSKILATTTAGRNEAKEMTIKELKLQVVHDFRQLGFTCIGVHKIPNQDAQAAAEEARLRTQRVQTLSLNREEKKRLVKTSPMKVYTAATQWAKPKKATVKLLTTGGPSNLGQKQKAKMR